MCTIKLNHPFTKVIAGPTGSGKTYYIQRLLKDINEIIDQPPEKIIFCFAEWQGVYDRLSLEHSNLSFIEGLPTRDQLSGDCRKLLIIDDLMQETDGRVTNIFTKGSHHQNMSVIYIVQNVFSKNKEHRTITLNTHYFVIFKNPRDVSQIVRLASQMFPKKTGYMLDAYKEATSKPHSYLFIDLKQNTPDHMRLRSNIFSGETQVVYIPR